MAQVFASAPRRGAGWFSRPVALWQCAAACVVFAVGGYGLHVLRGEREPAPEARQTTVYIIQTDPRLLREAVDATVRERPFLSEPVEPRIGIGEAKRTGADAI